MSRNVITAVDADVARMVSLRELYLDGNLLVSLPKEVGRLSSLVKLDLRDNRLVALPRTVGACHALTVRPGVGGWVGVGWRSCGVFFLVCGLTPPPPPLFRIPR